MTTNTSKSTAPAATRPASTRATITKSTEPIEWAPEEDPIFLTLTGRRPRTPPRPTVEERACQEASERWTAFITAWRDGNKEHCIVHNPRADEENSMQPMDYKVSSHEEEYDIVLAAMRLVGYVGFEGITDNTWRMIATDIDKVCRGMGGTGRVDAQDRGQPRRRFNLPDFDPWMLAMPGMHSWQRWYRRVRGFAAPGGSFWGPEDEACDSEEDESEGEGTDEAEEASASPDAGSQ